MKRHVFALLFLLLTLSLSNAAPTEKPLRPEIVDPKDQHGAIGITEDADGKPVPHTSHPDAQWFQNAGFGLFIHWGLSSVFDARGKRVGDLSWPMMVGAWKNKRFNDPEDQQRIIRTADWNFDGKPPVITPNQYWAAASDFNPQSYDPDKWIKAAKEAGFTYAVLTTRHHEGFAMWPSAYGDFSTKNFMGAATWLGLSSTPAANTALRSGSITLHPIGILTVNTRTSCTTAPQN